MDWAVQCAAVIPCRNEAATIEKLLREVRGYVSTVIVVDDGSTDNTALLAARAGAEVLRHDRSQGKGAALRTGLQRACQRAFPWALLLDGDGQHCPEDIPGFFQCAERTGASLVVGNRLSDSAPMPWLRRQVNRWMSARLSQVAGHVLPDSQCGFRLLQLAAWAALDLRTQHFEIDSEVLLAFILAGQPVEFVPIRVIYKTEQSKIHPWIDTWRWLHWLWIGRKNVQSPKSKVQSPKSKVSSQ